MSKLKKQLFQSTVDACIWKGEEGLIDRFTEFTILLNLINKARLTNQYRRWVKKWIKKNTPFSPDNDLLTKVGSDGDYRRA